MDSLTGMDDSFGMEWIPSESGMNSPGEILKRVTEKGYPLSVIRQGALKAKTTVCACCLSTTYFPAFVISLSLYLK